MTARLVTRKPTGLPPWPITLIAGREKAGKSWACAEASASDAVARTFWVGAGEDAPDEYGALPGVRFEIVEHDGTYRGILGALTAAAAQPKVDGKPNLIVLDSGTRLWNLLSDEQQVVANDRARRKAEKARRPIPDEDATITMDQWNVAKQRWQHCLDALRDHDGPSIITARLEETTVLDAAGQPTKDRIWKIQAEKNLASDVGVIIEMPARGEAWITGLRSVRRQLDAERVRFDGFEKLWQELGVTEPGATAPRRHAQLDPEDPDTARAELLAMCEANGWKPADVAHEYEGMSGTPIAEETSPTAIRRFMAALPNLMGGDQPIPGQTELQVAS